MHLTFHGAARSVTGANYLIETAKSKVLVDCGLIQGGKHAEDENYLPFPYKAAAIQTMLLTHAHIDHSGRLPKLFKDGFAGKVFATHPTKDLAAIMLEDSMELIAREAEKGKRAPLYDTRDVEYAMRHVEGVEYGEMVDIAPDMRARFRDAGHILGSAIIELWVKEGEKETKLVFSGDLGNPPVPLLRATELIDEADYVIVESAYGNRRHESISERKNLLEDIIEDTVTRGGTLMIPAFAIERTQEILFELNSLVENHRIPRVPVFVDSPLAIKAIGVYAKYEHYYNKKVAYIIESGDQIFKFPGLVLTRTTDESKAINNVAPPKIIIAGSGMSVGGRILHHELRYIPDPQSTLLLVGYQVAGSLGRQILDGASEVTILGEKVPVRAAVVAIGGYSAHADQEILAQWVKNIKLGGKLKKVFAVQGEEEAALVLAQILRDREGIDAQAPMHGETVNL